MTRLFAVALALSLAAPALGREVSGVNVAEELEAGGQQLKLNGAGLRKKFIVKVYVGALYLPAPAREADAVITPDVPKAVRMHFLRDVGKDKVMGAFREGFENNSADQAKELMPKLAEVEAAIGDLKQGQVLEVLYLPGTGSVIGVDGQNAVTIPGKPFADALFRNWLGQNPADGGLKEAMLGK